MKKYKILEYEAGLWTRSSKKIRIKRRIDEKKNAKIIKKTCPSRKSPDSPGSFKYQRAKKENPRTLSKAISRNKKGFKAS